MARGVTFRKKRQNRLGMILISVVVLMLCLVLAVKGHTLKEKRQAYDDKIESLERQIESENNRTAELQAYEKYTKTAKYVEEVAKDKLGLVYEDEIVFESGVNDER